MYPGFQMQQYVPQYQAPNPYSHMVGYGGYGGYGYGQTTGLDQIVGLEQIVGQAVQDALARASVAPRGWFPAGAPVQAPMQPGMGGPALVRQVPTRAREFVIGFGPLSVGAGATAIFTSNPQLPFRPSRLGIPAATAGGFSVNDVKVGKDSQFLSSGAVPAALFSEGAVGVAMSMDTCDIGQQLSLSVTNNGGAASTFAAGLFGTSVY